ncbi:MAG: glutamate--cysteine ligase [Gammaproteobacteria bacterium]|jgi:glutamate--cysteine ligase|nr:glutamate--cysteine ligase [Gammaproteobacteria bacterium]|tara:strand:+ start:4144 stop:5742 length:1599 start_codon:yes stop_codon:yes gene_type:complete
MSDVLTTLVAESINTKLNHLIKFPEVLTFNRGIEREALRVDMNGNLAQTPHPAFLGSKLCHPMITTDFSEAQLELITPVSNSISDSLSTLDRIHRYVYSGLNEELLWSGSMPCVIPENDDIPLAQYGQSNLGRLKTTYRSGLGHRYGRAMQTICAIHYNFSFTDDFWLALSELENAQLPPDEYRSCRYFDLMRNFRRFSWLLVYLFGASPIVCKSFIKGRKHNLQEFDYGSAYLPDATSLRNGNLGYQSDTQSGLLNICYNSLEHYVETLRTAICTPHPVYHELQSPGEIHPQVNGNILQSEAEFYTTIRAKCIPPKGENFLKSLSREGVEYIEVRLLDINPYLPLGIDADQMRFLDTFLLFCLVADSPTHNDVMCAAVSDNVLKAVHQGRRGGLLLNDDGKDRSLSNWGEEILAAISPVAEILDKASSTQNYTHSLAEQKRKLEDPNKTPSARILNDMQEEAVPFFQFAMNKATAHRQSFLSAPLSRQEQDEFAAMSEQSIRNQTAIEEKDTVPFDRYLSELQDQYEQLGS